LSKAIKDRLHTTNQKKNDILSNLLEAHQAMKYELDYGEEASNKTPSDVMAALLFAGYNTTSITLSYAIYRISQYPEIEEACLAEIDAVSEANVSELVYCKAVVQETLRLYPPGPATSWDMEKPLELSSGLTIPADAEVMVAIWSIHRCEENFPREDEFLPERWANGTKRA